MSRIPQRLGLGATVTVPVKHMIPMEPMVAVFPMHEIETAILFDLVVIGLGTGQAPGLQTMVKLRWPQHPHLELWTKPQHIKIINPGPVDKYFMHTHDMPVGQETPFGTDLLDTDDPDFFNYVSDDDNFGATDDEKEDIGPNFRKYDSCQTQEQHQQEQLHAVHHPQMHDQSPYQHENKTSSKAKQEPARDRNARPKKDGHGQASHPEPKQPLQLHDHQHQNQCQHEKEHQQQIDQHSTHQSNKGATNTNPATKTLSIVWEPWSEIPVDYRDVQFGEPNASLSMEQADYCSVFNVFEMMIPKEFIMSNILPATNEAGRDIPDFTPLRYGEFMRFIGLWFLFTCFQEDIPTFWSSSKSELFTAPQVSQYMTKKRFSDILAALSIVRLVDFPRFPDRYAPMRPFVEAWNLNMRKVYCSSWINVFDRIDCLYAHKYHASGFLSVPKRCHPTQNAYYVLVDGQTNIIYWAELDETRSRPMQLGLPAFADQLDVRAARMMRCIDVAGLANTGKVLHFDYQFASLSGLVELRKKNVFACVALYSSSGGQHQQHHQHKNPSHRQDQPSHQHSYRHLQNMPQEFFTKYLSEQPIGTTLCRPATCDDQPLYFVGVRDSRNMLMQLSTYGRIIPGGKVKQRSENVVFQYPEVIHNYLAVRRAPHVNESLRHDWRPIEDVWIMKQFWHGHFAFFLGLSEANAYFAYTRFVQKGAGMTHISFRKLLARELITNHYLVEEEELLRAADDVVTSETQVKRTKTSDAHRLESIPFHSTWDGSSWRQTLRVQQVQRRCKYCKKKTRHYCVCNPSKSICTLCFARHMVDELSV